MPVPEDENDLNALIEAKRHLRGTVRRPYLLNVPNTAYCSPPYGGGRRGASSIFFF